MAIARTARPLVLIYGTVESIRDLHKKPENGGDLYGYEPNVKHPSGSLAAYTVYKSDATALPKVGDFVAVECSIEEHPRFGASLTYEGPGATALDVIASTLSAAK